MSTMNQGLEQIRSGRLCEGLTAQSVARSLEMISALLAERIELLEAKVALLETKLAESPWACVCGEVNTAEQKACRRCTRGRR